MSKPGQRFSTVRAEAGSPLAQIKDKLTEVEKLVHDVLDPNDPAVGSALQHLDLFLHVLGGVPASHEVPHGETVEVPKQASRGRKKADGPNEPESEAKDVGE